MPMKCLIHVIAFQLLYLLIHFRLSQDKTKHLHIFKPYTKAESRKLIKFKHHVEKNSNAILLHTETNIWLYDNVRNSVTKLTAKANLKHFSDKMVQANSRPKLIWKFLMMHWAV